MITAILPSEVPPRPPRQYPRLLARRSCGRWKRSTKHSSAESKAQRLRDRIDADPKMSDAELFKIVAALFQLEPPLKPNKPSGAVSKEARIAMYGERYDRGEELWNTGDAIHGHGFREQIVKVVKAGSGGKQTLVKRVAIFDAAGEFISMGRL